MRYFRTLIVACLVFCLGFFGNPGNANAASQTTFTYEELQNLSYDDIVGTGLANQCPILATSTDKAIPLDSGVTYRLVGMCIQPTDYFVKQEVSRREEAFVPANVVTRYTTTLDQVSGTLVVNADGSLTFAENDGFDFQPITVQVPSGERVPFFFTVKRLVATSSDSGSSLSTDTKLVGDFIVPSYRGAGFLDPKGRGVATGYDNAVALPANADITEYSRTNARNVNQGVGEISFQITQINDRTGEVAGVFLSEQPGDTDLGAAEPEEVQIRGIFYARLGIA